MKERIKAEIEKTKELNEKMLKAFIPPFYEIDYNRGYIDGLRFALEQIEKHEVKAWDDEIDKYGYVN